MGKPFSVGDLLGSLSFVEVVAQGIELLVPVFLEIRKPVVHLPQTISVKPIEPPPSLRTPPNQSCAMQASQVFRYRWLADGKRPHELRHRLFALVGQTARQGAPRSI